MCPSPVQDGIAVLSQLSWAKGCACIPRLVLVVATAHVGVLPPGC
jgi:hypothetical protein